MTKCTHPDHAPAAGPRPPGLYIHRCPACGVRSSFVVRAPPSTALAVLAAMLLAGAACGRGPACPSAATSSRGDTPPSVPACPRKGGG